jgi:hypothetical protein
MITRPLDLASRLRPPPRHLDALFWVNTGLVALLFLFFGSRFVLSPGLSLLHEGFALPAMGGAVEGARPTTDVISLPRPGMVLTDDGLHGYASLRGWLARRAAALPPGQAFLLIQADVAVPMVDLVRLHDMAREAGFAGVQLAVQGLEGAVRAR